MTPQELKNSILQLAIQGKLVEQRPEEGTAAELYQQIQREKQALIKAGKLKKGKPLPEITEDEKPFDIPEGWMWVRIASVTLLNPKNDIADDTEVGFIPMSCISDGYRNKHTFEIRKWGEIKKGFIHFANGDIGVSKITPCFQNRKSVVFHNLPNGYGAGTTELSIVRVPDAFLIREYLLWFFKSEYFISNGKKSFTGTAGQQRIHKDYLALCAFPLPPLAEQKRIVSRIEELLPLVERYEAAWNRLEDLNKRFPDDMQKSILQLAIQGKLVEQRPEEGTGEELFRQIQTEKQALIRAGKLKKEKIMPEISEGEIPFEIPKIWIWVRLGRISNELFAGGDKPSDFTKKADNKRKVPVIANGVSNDGVLGYTAFPTAKANTITVAGRGTIGFSLYRDYEYCPVVRLIVIEQCNGIFPQYLQCVLQALPEKSLGTSIPQLTVPMLCPKLIPLPPLAEQKRIIARLEELLALCKKLK